MGDNFKYVAGKNYSLTGSGISGSATSITITAFKDINGNDLAMSDFGTIGYLVLEPKTSKAEIVSFTGVTNNGDGTSTITGVTRGLAAKAPYTAAGYGQSHSGGAVAIISNVPQMYDEMVSKANDETISGTWTFTTSPVVPTGGTGTQAANATDIANAITGASGTATESVFGTVKTSVAPASAGDPIAVGDNDTRVPTQNENDALVGTSGTAVSSSNKLVDAADVSSAAASGKIVRAIGTALPALSGASLTGITPSQVGALSALGAWASASYDGNAHQVTTDGFLIGTDSCSNSSSTASTLAVDTSNPPTTVRATMFGNNTNGTTSNIPFCVPIHKNEYYKYVAGTNHSASGFFIPLS